jgi:hypothetical protein
MHDEREGMTEQGSTRGDESTAGRENTTFAERGEDERERDQPRSADSAAGEGRSLADDMDRALRVRNGEERGEVH